MSTAFAGKVIPLLTCNVFSVNNCRYKFNLMNDKIDYHRDTEVQNFLSELAHQTSRCVLFVKNIIEFCEDTFWCSSSDHCERW